MTDTLRANPDVLNAKAAAMGVSPELRAAIDDACARIAPAWSLDRLIAVSPYWGYVQRPIAEVAAELGAIAGTTLTMPRAWFAAQLAQGEFQPVHVGRSIARSGSSRTVKEVLAALEVPAPPHVPHRLMPALVDELRADARGAKWVDVVVQNISAACGAFFGGEQARWSPDVSRGLYGVWRDLASHDVSPRLLMGLRGFGEQVRAFPADPEALIAAAVVELGVAPEARTTYFSALLMNVPGWAAASAFRRWEARLRGEDDDTIVHLLAMRLAWELVLLRKSGAPGLATQWLHTQDQWTRVMKVNQKAQEIDWLLQGAMELAYKESLGRVLLASSDLYPAAEVARAQAVFCIDVRSEVMRRALEASDAGVQTLGFAGFFGLPIAYVPTNGVARPQLPGLLAPSLHVGDEPTRGGVGAEQVSSDRALGADRQSLWKDLVRAPMSMFTAVEATGMGYAAVLARNAIAGAGGVLDPLRGALATAEGQQAATRTTPRLVSRASDGSALDADARSQLAASVLRGMSLTHDFAPLVAFIGHGATTANNPQAAGLACGACGGQSGEVNARVLAALLNEPEVRRGMVAHGITVPDTTHFVAGLHDTVTDVVTLHDLELVPESHHRDVALFSAALTEAGVRARRERAPRLGLGDVADRPDKLLAAMRKRSGDWSEVRPEWGLARNAAFIIAPRERTRGRNLDGRTFLHEYRWEEDTGFAVLEGILTAPMLVTHWINMQYHASTVDPERFGSGDKVLHNVAGGDVGVFEGAGGDLRIGLAKQSVHDGTDWVHVPLRLTVVVDAPTAAIDAILAKHPTVAALVKNDWLFLLRLDAANGALHRRRFTGWQLISYKD